MARWSTAAWALLALALLSSPTVAQERTFSMAVRDVPVRVALEELVTLSGISLVYSSDVVEGRYTVCRRDDAPAEELLRCIVEGAELDFYRLSSGTYVVIEGPEELPAYGTVSGQILDALTGEPVRDAIVEVGDRSRSTRSSAAGLFVLPRLAPGPLELRVTQPGYTPLALPIELGSFERVRREVRLDPQVVEIDPLVVDGIPESADGVRSGWRGSSFSDGVPRQGDLSTEVRSGLGVGRRPLFADLSVQGSAPGEHMVRLDGVPIFHPVALGRTRSAFSPLALRRITVRKAGFAAEHGSFTGGVIDVEQGVSDPEGPGGVTVLADPLGANGDVSLPLRVGTGEGSVMLTVRQSLWGLYREPSLDEALRDWNQMDPVLTRQIVGDGATFTDALQYQLHRHGSDVEFGDVHAAARLRFPGFRSVGASFYRGTNRVATELFSAGSTESGGTLDRLAAVSERYDWSNVAGRVTADWLVGARGAMRVRAWASRHELDHDYRIADGEEVGYDPDTSDVATVEEELRTLLERRRPNGDGNRVEEIGAEVAGDVMLGRAHTLTAGLEVASVDSRLQLGDMIPTPLASDLSGWRIAGHLSDRWRIGSAVILEGGLRVTSVPRGNTYAEPRASIRVEGVDGILGPWSAQLSGGLFRQYTNQFELTNLGPSALVPSVQFWLPVDGSVEPPRARHLVAELVARPGAAWEVRTSAYHKSLDRILSLDYGALTEDHGVGAISVDQAHFVGVAQGVAYGVGGSIAWERGRARLGTGLEWSVSERSFPSRFGGVRQMTPWNEPLRLTFDGRLPLGAGFAVEAETHSAWGRTWALRRAYYDFLTVEGTDGGPSIGLPEEDELPTLHQVDVGLSWLGRVGSTLAEIRADVVNLAPRQVLDYSLVRDASSGPSGYRRIERLLPPTALLLSLRIGL